MRTVLAIASILVVAAMVGQAGAETWPAMPARLSVAEGEVLVQGVGSREWIVASVNFPLGPGDRVWVTGGGRAEVRFADGAIVRLNRDTSIELGGPSVRGPLGGRIGVERGTAIFSVRRIRAQGGLFQVDLPQASLRASAISTFRSDLLPDGSFQVSVRSGEVLVETAEGSIGVRTGDFLRFDPDLRPHLYALVEGDDFDRWSNLRDRELSRVAGTAHIPPELAAYGPEFGTHGRWVKVPSYGHVWAPFVETGWTPFRDGRWVRWQDELTWVSDEPWGWAPYHHGRWWFAPGIGWVWVPPVEPELIWSPGAVAWLHGPEFVAWVPLAPGEIYHPSTTYVHVTHVHITKTFVNAKARNAWVVAKKGTFHAGGRGSASSAEFPGLFTAGARAAFGPPPGAAPSRPAPLPSHPVRMREARPVAIGHGVGEFGSRQAVAGPIRSSHHRVTPPGVTRPDTPARSSASSGPFQKVPTAVMGRRVAPALPVPAAPAGGPSRPAVGSRGASIAPASGLSRSGVPMQVSGAREARPFHVASPPRAVAHPPHGATSTQMGPSNEEVKPARAHPPGVLAGGR